nr:zinc finger, PMZ-type [Tanacetum cinerariifolium]
MPCRIGSDRRPTRTDSDRTVPFRSGPRSGVLDQISLELNGYDALDIRDQGKTIADDEGNESSDADCFSDDEDLSYVDFHTEVDDNVVIKTVTTNDPFINKDWNKMEHVLGMRGVQAGRCAGYDTIKKGKKQLGDDKEKKMWQLSGIQCVHSVAAYNHLNRDPIEGVDHWYSKEKWFEAYQFSIKPVFGKVEGQGGGVKGVQLWVKEMMVWVKVVELVRGLKEEGDRVREAEERVREAVEGVIEEGAMTKDEIRKHIKHEYMKEILLEEEQKREANLKDEQDMFDQEALRYTLEEEARNVMTIAANVQTQESIVANLSDRGEIGFRLGDFKAKGNHKYNAELEITSAEPITTVTLSADKGKQVAEPNEEPNPEPQAKKNGSKRKALASSEEVSLRIIFYKNMGRSERIFNQK